jgi:hypothetical protein
LIQIFSCTAKKQLTGPELKVTPLSDTTILRDGSLVYALPRTVLTIETELERVIEIPGPYARYADELLGLGNVIMKKNEYWTIRGIKINSHQEADPSEYYVIETNSIINANVLMLKEEGFILDLNPEKSNTAVINMPASEINLNRYVSFDLGSDEYYSSVTDTAFRRVRVDSTFIRVPYIVEKKKKLTGEQLAERAARRLMELRDGKILILTGEANVFPQDEAAIDEINRLEQGYLELFTGRRILEKRVFMTQFTPDKTKVNEPVTLFIFKDRSGPSSSASNTGSGLPVNIILQPEEKTKDITLISREQSAVQGITSDKVYYRIPDMVNIKVIAGNELLYSSRKLVYQFGEILQLPSNYLIGK